MHSNLTTGERIDLLLDAQRNLETAIHQIRDAVTSTCVEDRAGAYILPHLEGWASDLTNQPGNLDELMNELEDDAAHTVEAVYITLSLLSVQLRDARDFTSRGYYAAHIYPAQMVDKAIVQAKQRNWRIRDIQDPDGILSAFELNWLKGRAGVPAPRA
jgi:hypothetical protein